MAVRLTAAGAARSSATRAAPVAGAEERGLGRVLLSTARDLRTVADRQLQVLGLTMQQAEILVGVARHGAITPRRLTALVLTDDAGVSRLVDRLVAKGLVRRRGSARDRRSVTLELTPTGRAQVSRLLRHRARVNRHLFARISDTEAARLRAVLRRISENARAMPSLFT